MQAHADPECCVHAIQTGLLLLQGGRFAEAMDAFAACPPEVFQPAQLLHLFPDTAGRWIAAGLPGKPYWGLHGQPRSE